MAKKKTTKKQKSINKATNRYFTEHSNAIMFNYADEVKNLTSRKAKHLFKEEIKKRVEGGQTANKAARDILREQDIEIKVRHASSKELATRRAVNKAWAENKERIVSSYKEINPAISEDQARFYFNMTVRRDLSVSNRTPASATQHILLTNTFTTKKEREASYENQILTGKLASLKGQYRAIKKALGVKQNETLEKAGVYIRWDAVNGRYRLFKDFVNEKGQKYSKAVDVWRPDKYKDRKLRFTVVS